MKIEDEIKQSAFSSEYNKAIVNIIFTANWLLSRHNKALKEFNISSQQFNILRILRGQYPKPASINLLTERMLDKMSNASRLVDKLQTKGLVERSTCPEDRRQVNVVISEKGLTLLKILDEKMKKDEASFSFIEPKEYETLNKILDHIRDANF